MSQQLLEPPTRLAGSGDAAIPGQMFASLYEELHSIAQRELRRNRYAQSLGATTLLHEAYLNFGRREGVHFPDRAHFLAYATRAMRGLIINYARSCRALKRGAEFELTELPTEVPQECADSAELERLSDAIERLAVIDPKLAQIVDLKYFGGFSFVDIASMWDVSERTVQRNWEKARLFLHQTLSTPTVEVA